MTGNPQLYSISTLLVVFLAGLLAACDQRMAEQPKYEALEASALFENKQAARHPPAGSIARDEPLVSSDPADGPPLELNRADIERGERRFRIYCMPCHGVLGNGEGPVVQRGFPSPPSYHIARLREANLDYFFQVITSGHGVMHSYADRVEPADRWRIALYIRALQRSQQIDVERLPQFREPVEQAATSDNDTLMPTRIGEQGQ
ncbi:cytochrome c [Proteobacteria bacterium 005FR1]|nr:cytochrome c [Proteobacteria bacterium 005FR1]